MKRLWKWIIGLFGVAALASTAKASSTPAPSTSSSLASLRAELAAVGITGDWALWLLAVARHESGWGKALHNGTPSEVAASLKAAKRLLGISPQGTSRYASCWNAGNINQLAQGSGGRWQVLTAYAPLRYPAPFNCSPPLPLLLDFRTDIAQAVEGMRGVWNMGARTPLELRVAWALPTAFTSKNAAKFAAVRKYFEKDAAASGAPPGWIDKPIATAPPWRAEDFLREGPPVG